MSNRISSRSIDRVLIFFALAAIGFVANYLFVAGFGIYEDDYFFTLSAYQWTYGQLWENIKAAWISWPQFRPLGFSLTHLVTFVTAQFESLVPAYLLGLGLHTLNGWLLFRIASIRVRPSIAFVAAAVFILYPSDTGKIILMLRVFQVFNLTMVLSAILLYLHGWRFCSYVVAAGCLLTYEHFFLAFLVAPFALGKLHPFPYRRFALHFSLCAGLPAILMAARKFLGDERSADVLASPLQTLGRMIQACFIGPHTAVTALFERPRDAFWNSDALQWGVIALVTGLVVIVIHRVTEGREANSISPESTVQETTKRELALLAGGGALCLAASYALAIRPDNFPPIVNLGRLSGFNTPGSVSCCLLFAAIAELILRWIARYETIITVVGAVYVGLLVSFGIEIQRSDYLKHWQQQKNLWNTVFATSGEWQAGIPIIIDVRNANAPEYFTNGFPFYWTVVSTPLGSQHFLAPEEWKRFSESIEKAPRVFGYYPELGADTVDGGLRLHTPPWSGAELWPIIRPNQFILFRFEDGKLKRTSAPLILPQGDFTPLPAPQTPPPLLPVSRLHHILFGPSTEWPSILHGRNYPR